jgi:hypothetical protein
MLPLIQSSARPTPLAHNGFIATKVKELQGAMTEMP